MTFPHTCCAAAECMHNMHTLLTCIRCRPLKPTRRSPIALWGWQITEMQAQATQTSRISRVPRHRRACLERSSTLSNPHVKRRAGCFWFHSHARP